MLCPVCASCHKHCTEHPGSAVRGRSAPQPRASPWDTAAEVDGLCDRDLACQQQQPRISNEICCPAPKGAVRLLSQLIAQSHFVLKRLPPGALCPPVPSAPATLQLYGSPVILAVLFSLIVGRPRWVSTESSRDLEPVPPEGCRIHSPCGISRPAAKRGSVQHVPSRVPNTVGHLGECHVQPLSPMARHGQQTLTAVTESGRRRKLGGPAPKSQGPGLLPEA